MRGSWDRWLVDLPDVFSRIFGTSLMRVTVRAGMGVRSGMGVGAVGAVPGVLGVLGVLGVPARAEWRVVLRG